MATLVEGTVFAGRYRVLRCLATGGMGAVYEAVHIDTDRHRALKVMHPHLFQSDEMRERFKLEARIAAHVESEYIVDVSDAGVTEDTRGRRRRINQRDAFSADDADGSRPIGEHQRAGAGIVGVDWSVLARVGEAADAHVRRDRCGSKRSAPTGGDDEATRGARETKALGIGAGEGNGVAAPDLTRATCSPGRREHGGRAGLVFPTSGSRGTRCWAT